MLLVDTSSPTPGIITKRDFLKVSFSKSLKMAKVRDIMTQPVRHCSLNPLCNTHTHTHTHTGGKTGV